LLDIDNIYNIKLIKHYFRKNILFYFI